MKLMTTKGSQDENVYDLLPTKSENVFHKETKPRDIEGGGVCVRVQPVFLGADQGIDECDGK
jgi:hypothetical protein